MASTASPSFSFPIPTYKHRHLKPRGILIRASSDDSSGEPTGTKRKPVVDTRIHWSNPDEGWIGGKSSKAQTNDTEKKEPMGQRFSELINKTEASHYQFSILPRHSYTKGQIHLLLIHLCIFRFLGVSPEADIEEIKSAYRRLSKEYHPDTTSLPLKTASEKFMQLREAYNVLSKENSRQFYDWTLAQEVESRRAQRMRMRLEDPYEQDLDNFVSIPDTVDRLEGKNMKLSDQALTALTIDFAAIIISICCIIYAIFFKEQY